jgi:type II secretory pathway pseudopilin PulG
MMIAKHKKAFSMITAIFVIVIMATVGMLVVNVTGKIIKETTTQYRKEQAILLAKSYTEFAIMAVTANNRTSECIEDIDGNNIIANDASGKGYQVQTRISYIGKDSTAHLTSKCAARRVLANDVATDGSDLQIIVDVYVRYKELDNTGADWITYHRRTLQKI